MARVKSNIPGVTRHRYTYKRRTTHTSVRAMRLNFLVTALSEWQLWKKKKHPWLQGKKRRRRSEVANSYQIYLQWYTKDNDITASGFYSVFSSPLVQHVSSYQIMKETSHLIDLVSYNTDRTPIICSNASS